MSGCGKRLTLTVLVLSLTLFLACKRNERPPDGMPAGSDSAVAPTTAGATDTSYVGGGGNITTSTGPTSTDTVGTTGSVASSSGATSTSAKADAAKSKKAKTEPGQGKGKKP